MRFQHYGKTCQLRIETAKDLANILELDESLWVATSAPTNVFRCDAAFIDLMDSNHDGRINTREVRDAVKWILTVLADTSRVADGVSVIALSAIRDDSRQSRDLLSSAQKVLRTLGEDDRENVSLEHVRRFLDHLRQQPMNGDGIIVPAAAREPAMAEYIADATACTGGRADAGGDQGVSGKDVEAFQAAVSAYLDWRQRSVIPPGSETTEIMPFGPDTPCVYEVYSAHADRVEMFFALCRALRFEPRAAGRLGCQDSELQALDFTKPQDLSTCLERAPLAKPTDDARLPLHENSVNPLFRAWIGELRAKVLTRVLGKIPEFLEEADWQAVKSCLAPYEAYLADKPGGGVEKLPVEKLCSYRDGSFQETAQRLIETDKQVTDVLESTRELERLLLYHQHLLRYANNFVSFSQLYEVDQHALFEMGSVVIDGRWFSMALKVDDQAAHEKLAKRSNIFTLYVEVTSREDDRKFIVAVPATAGSRGNLCVGKRGVFFDTQDKEYNARVIKIIENPISIREALAVPFVKLWDFVVGKIESMSGASEKGLQKQADTLMQAPQTGAMKTTAGPAGILVALSFSAAAIGSAFAFITKTFTGMDKDKVLLGFLGAALVVAVPVTLVAVLKLRRQDLSSLLEGCGWAVNARMRFNRAQRRQFTKRVRYPEGAKGTPRRRWLTVLLLAILLAALALLLHLS